MNPRGTCAPIRFRVGRLQPGSATPPRNHISTLHVAPTFNLRFGCGRVLVLSRCHPIRRRDEPLDGRAQVIRGRAQVYPRHDEAGDESVRVANPKGRPLERGPSPSGDSPAKVNCELSSRYLPRPSTPVPCISQIPRLCRHQPPPRVHCCASLNIGLGVGAGIFEAHPARSHTIAPISIASRTMVHLHYAAKGYRVAPPHALAGGAERQVADSPSGPAGAHRLLDHKSVICSCSHCWNSGHV